MKNIRILLPVFGNILFVILYVIAALLYPGGSEVDKNDVGYSWINNYWCNLLSEGAINGQLNSARPVAIAAMVILCISLTAFWILFPLLTGLKKNHRLFIQIAGTVSMITSFLLLTNVDHDRAVNVSSSLGFIAVIGTLIALRQMEWSRLFIFGLFNVLLIALNNYLYYTKQMTYLPVVQKFSFLAFLVWFCLINVHIYHITQSRLKSI